MRAVPVIIAAGLLASACASPFDTGSSAATAIEVQIDAPGVEPREVDIDPLYVSISIHVEGWTMEADDRGAYELHRDGLLQLAHDAADAGAVITFELSQVYMDAVASWDDAAALREIESLGHSIAIHADAGGRGVPTEAGLVADLRHMVDSLARLGFSTPHVSGICSRGPWVEAALGAGFTSASGGVAYCATSLDPAHMPDGYEYLYDCAGPAACHGVPPIPDEQRVHPWLADSSSDWVVTGADSGLAIVPGGPDIGDRCEPEPCARWYEDADVLAFMIDEALELRSDAELAGLALSWSIGSIPEPGQADALFAAVAGHVEAGEVTWAGADTIGQLAQAWLGG
ncbi:MAG: hypothetical protein ACE5GB_08890 [Acidimicrobiales bacterium]